MGRTVGIHVWFDEFDPEDARRAFIVAADGIGLTAQLDNSRTYQQRYLRLSVDQQTPQNLVRSTELRSNDSADVLAAVGPRIEPDCEYTLGSVYQFKMYRSETGELETVTRPLELRVRGPEFGVDQYYWRRGGCLQASFANIENFQVSSDILRDTRRAIASDADATKLMASIGELAHNVDVIHDLARHVIRALNPRRVVVCTDWEVHPLTAHGLYHREISAFASDLTAILRIHVVGGLYPFEGPAMHAVRPPVADYGYLRNGRATAYLIDRLNDLSRSVGSREIGLLSSTPEVVRRVLADAADSSAIPMLSSLYLVAGDGVFGYLEQAFFDLAREASSANEDSRFH